MHLTNIKSFMCLMFSALLCSILPYSTKDCLFLLYLCLSCFGQRGVSSTCEVYTYGIPPGLWCFANLWRYQNPPKDSFISSHNASLVSFCVQLPLDVFLSPELGLIGKISLQLLFTPVLSQQMPTSVVFVCFVLVFFHILIVIYLQYGSHPSPCAMPPSYQELQSWFVLLLLSL